MRMQPGLAALANARLLLFQSFTFPSIQQQTNTRFLWIIRTDPDLNAQVKEKLKRLVATLPNAVLVASNQNPEGFRGTAIDDITEASILVGDIQLVRAFHNASETRRLLETRLDADDALNVQFCDSIQELARKQLKSGWLVWCAERHVEWHFASPWPSGTLLGLQTNQCVTPGLTYGYMPGTQRSQITIRNNHALLHKRLPSCTSEHPSSCLARTGSMPLALRARTPTSAGMDGIWNNTELTNAWREAQPNLWKSIPPMFGIYEDDLRHTRMALAKDMPAIVQDALSGQCTKGHSCKKASRQILQSILNFTIQQPEQRVA
jgi:Putative rhamnosyl transferase